MTQAQTSDRQRVIEEASMTILVDQLALKIEYAKLLRRLDKLNGRVAKARKAGVSDHQISRLSLRRLNGWARLYNAASPATRRAMGWR
jgi:hypothetical protein